jgi:hypothetical protein
MSGGIIKSSRVPGRNFQYTIFNVQFTDDLRYIIEDFYT